jgi:hypothetical protein
MVHLRDHAMKASPTNKLLHGLMHHEVGISVDYDMVSQYTTAATCG